MSISEKKDEKDVAPEFPAGVDDVLRTLIGLANYGPASVAIVETMNPVTVWVKGVQFTGHVVADKDSREWMFKRMVGKIEGYLKLASDRGIPQEELDDSRAKLEKGKELLSSSFEHVPPPTKHDALSLKDVQVRGALGKVDRFEMVRIRIDQIDAITPFSPPAEV